MSLAAGTYYTGGLTVSKSGTAIAPIILRGASGAILDGADPASFTWTPGSNGLFSTTVNQPDPHLALAQGQRLYPHSELASVTSLSASSTSGFFPNGTSVTVHLAGGVDPSSASLQVSRYDGLGICPGESSATTNETDFYENESYDNGDDGLETDGRCANVRLWKNVIHDTLSGSSLAPVIDGPVFCLRNRMYLLGAGHSEAGYSGLSFKFNSSDGDSGSIYLFHNTVDAQRASNDGLSIQSPSTWVRVMARNNIWAGTRYAIANNLDPLPPLDMDYDDLWGPNNNDLVYWQGLSNRHLAFGSVFAATGQENHAFNVTPGFVAPDTADFTLTSSSLLIDRGCHIPGINDGFTGAGPDVGAIESH